MPRTRPTRFAIGERVQIRDVIMTPHAGKEGRVVRRIFCPGAHTLDRYEVQLSSGEVKTFWDIQLSATEPQINQQTAR